MPNLTFDNNIDNDTIFSQHSSKQSGFLLQHNKTHHQIANMTSVAMQAVEWEMMPYTPYISDLESSDFLSLDHFKKSVTWRYCLTLILN